MDRAVSSALKVALIYAVFAALWILFSDIVVSALIESEGLRSLAQTYKGLGFVTITAVLLLILVYRSSKVLQQVNDVDSLTGLFSLNMFIRSLGLAIDRKKPGYQIVLGYLDVDNFKSLNERLGYERADILLQELATGIRKTALPGAVVARLHADQFASFSVIESDFDVEEHALAFQRMFARCTKKLNIDATCSIGVAIFPADGRAAKELMVSATEALNVAKATGNAIQFHDKSLTEKAMKRRQMLMDLREAITSESLKVVYQPKYNLQTMSVSGAEVLVRWIHPVEGFIPPDVFIPLAEEVGLTSAISKLVVKKVSEELDDVDLLGDPLSHVAINISATEFNDADEMQALTSFILEKSRLAPFIRIEITETATLSNMKNSVEIISRLQSSGLTFSIDDFGTGYTSLAMLKDLTVDEIKIDRSFVSELRDDERSRTIVGAIIAMARSFGINIVAEGIETAEQLALLHEFGCLEAQGYYLGRPMPIDQLKAHIENAKAREDVPH
ncbi:putative bifunctional diguanylate cyclase/phosphodiesterase [Alteromonas sp. H39]|uniref:putative bifunctional diguanylate cyclase/phosphodiesterase n=1 Tax=Alteromonas sp. H39 TaxID=3389876 RepID=UPI0039E0CFF8